MARDRGEGSALHVDIPASGRRGMSLTLGQTDDLPINPTLAALPFDNGRLSQFAPIQIDMQRHNEAKASHPDMHPAVSDDVLRHFFDEGRQTVLHFESPCSNSEQRGVKPLTFVSGKTLIGLTLSVSVPFLPTVTFLRQTA